MLGTKLFSGNTKKYEIMTHIFVCFYRFGFQVTVNIQLLLSHIFI